MAGNLLDAVFVFSAKADEDGTPLCGISPIRKPAQGGLIGLQAGLAFLFFKGMVIDDL